MEADPTRAHAWGIADGYHDISGRWITPDPGAVSSVLAALGADSESPSAGAVRVVRQGAPVLLDEPHEVTSEDGAQLRAETSLPQGLPTGYHQLRRLRDGATWRLIVSPGSCYLPEHLRGWGWALQLYALRSAASWGIGDLGDLGDFAEWSSRLGAAVLLLNPLHAPLPLRPQEPSPYYPSSRRYRNPLYIRVEDVPGAERLGGRLQPLAEAAHDLNHNRLIDRDAVFDLKMAALEQLFDGLGPSAEFDRYCREEGRGLEDHATFCVLSETYGRPWQGWPTEVRHPDRPDVDRFRDLYRPRVRFHQWLQWLLDRQLGAAAGAVGLVHDLAIGVRPDGSDVWAWQDQFAEGVSVGAPPDPFNAAGQDWGLPPFDPWRLRAAGYEPFILTLRAAFRHGAGLRIDHVMGLFRQYWIPPGAGPERGVYVRYPYGDLLDILALESWRAGAFVIGEDLGTVEDRVREEMAARQMLSYHVLWFEDRPPAEYRTEAMAALTTHDLPTLAGVWEGSDSDSAVRDRLRRLGGATEGMSSEEAALAAHRRLAESPSRLVTATLEDALGVVDRPNRPGTTAEWPNWSLALPVTLEALRDHGRALRMAESLRR